MRNPNSLRFHFQHIDVFSALVFGDAGSELYFSLIDYFNEPMSPYDYS